MPARSLRARMTVLFTVTTTALMLLVSAGILAYSAHAERQAADRVLSASVRRVRSELTEEGGPTKPAELVRDENEPLEDAGGAMFILDRDGHVLAQSRRIVPSWPRVRDDGWRVAVVRTPEATVVIGLPWRRTEAALRARGGMLLGLTLWVGVVTAAVAWVLIGRILRPIQGLARQADTASAASLHVRLDAPSPDAELVELVGTFNRLLERLAHTAAARGRFYAAASHELRTPLQALSGHLELALTRTRTSGEYRGVVEEAFEQTRRLTRLVRELLLLNQLHQRTAQPLAEPTDLAGTTRHILFQLRGLLRESSLDVAADVPDEAEVLAPPAHVEIILRNLAENAAKYAVRETTLFIRIAHAADGWLFEIYNECADSLEVLPERLFEPFFRPDAARSSRTGGNGLGLAICKAVAEANAWSLDWRREERGVRACVGFPASAPAARPASLVTEETAPCPADVVAPYGPVRASR